MKKLKTAIVVMAKYCARWERPDIFKAWYEQARKPFSIMEEDWTPVISPVFMDHHKTKEGRLFWESVRDAIRFGVQFLPAPFQPKAESFGEKLDVPATEAGIVSAQFKPEDQPELKLPEKFSAWLETVTNEKDLEFFKRNFSWDEYNKYRKDLHPGISCLHISALEYWAETREKSIDSLYPWPAPEPADPLDTLQAGDLLADKIGNRVCVLARIEQVVFISGSTNKTAYSGGRTIFELKQQGWRKVISDQSPS